MALLAALKGNGATGFGFGSTAEAVCADLDLARKTILITGVNSGLGLESARVLARRGGHIVGLARTRDTAAAALASLGVECTPIACDLSDPTSVRAAVHEVKQLGRPIDALIANAGVMALPKLQQSHGYELQFFTNHIGHFILVTGLIDALGANGRVVVLSSDAHRFAPPKGIEFDNLSGAKGYAPMRAYGQSKLANILFARGLAKRFRGTSRTANSLHPGIIATNLSRHSQTFHGVVYATMGWLLVKSIGEGAATQCYLAVHPDAHGVTAEYWSDCNVGTPSTYARNDDLAERLWTESERIARAV